MSASAGRHFFISYSRVDTNLKQNIIKQLRARHQLVGGYGESRAGHPSMGTGDQACDS